MCRSETSSRWHFGYSRQGFLPACELSISVSSSSHADVRLLSVCSETSTGQKRFLSICTSMFFDTQWIHLDAGSPPDLHSFTKLYFTHSHSHSPIHTNSHEPVWNDFRKNKQYLNRISLWKHMHVHLNAFKRISSKYKTHFTSVMWLIFEWKDIQREKYRVRLVHRNWSMTTCWLPPPSKKNKKLTFTSFSLNKQKSGLQWDTMEDNGAKYSVSIVQPQNKQNEC